ncbi:hypothetical protein C8J55DRAFT_490877 [Lentinula edodes]|uniref:Uncharacterized protein n=1 Tax=Lentinula lateritia TaxID=40482 RepID=A0A9W9A3C0_9AGAR|nr:hypothetical protein C8J55DRAFT_490877 [Lentinula edodes]
MNNNSVRIHGGVDLLTLIIPSYQTLRNIREHPAYTTTPQKYERNFLTSRVLTLMQEDERHFGPFIEPICKVWQGSVILRSGGKLITCGYDNQRPKMNRVLSSVPVDAQKILLENSREVQGDVIIPLRPSIFLKRGLIISVQVQYEMEAVEGRLWKGIIISHVLVGEDFNMTWQDDGIEPGLNAPTHPQLAPCTSASTSSSNNVNKCLQRTATERLHVLGGCPLYAEGYVSFSGPSVANMDLEINDCCWGVLNRAFGLMIFRSACHTIPDQNEPESLRITQTMIGIIDLMTLPDSANRITARLFGTSESRKNY